MSSDAFDSLVLTGRIVNGGTAAIAEPHIWIEARDDAGRVLDCSGAPLSAAAGRIEPRQSAAFRRTTEAPFSMSRFGRWWATWSPADAVPLAVTAAYRVARQRLQDLLSDTGGAAPQDVAAARDAVRAEERATEAAGASPLPAP